ncbi:hypothetical protein GCM10009654_59640 [Streptomyces hebeiensis]|uniref:Uncharacterized protein n=1 Tax=Streptomyces hebeiensis TaxID=229486 RepID=A0ABN1V505_9ACTN|nr:hypothetical protein [Streptomyces sp. NRRL F-5135]
MSTVIRRVVVGSGHGTFKLPVNSSVTNRNSSVVVSISEIDANGNAFIGAARLAVYNVAPRDGGYDLWVEISWNSDLRYRITVLVSND